MSGVNERIGVLETKTEHVETLLHKHVSECAAMQKRVLVIGCCTLGWLVAHSPEVGKAALRLVEVITP